MKAWTYYKDRAGDFILVRNKAIARDVRDAVAPDKRGKPRSAELTVVNDKYLARCTQVAEADVPPLWREALTGCL